MMIGGSLFGNACGNVIETCFAHYVTARLAQSAERKALNLVVVGSIPGCVQLKQIKAFFD